MNVRTSTSLQNEHLLKNCRERARLFIEATPDPMCIHDPQGHILDANRAAVRTLGFTLNQLKQRSLDELFRDLDSETLTVHWKQLKAGDSHLWTGQLRHKRRPTAFVEIHSQRTSFRRRPVLVSVLRVSRSNEGAIADTTGHRTDRELTKALEQSEDRFRMLVE